MVSTATTSAVFVSKVCVVGISSTRPFASKELKTAWFVAVTSRRRGAAAFPSAAATITPTDGRAVLKWSADKKRLYLRRRRGLLLIVR